MQTTSATRAGCGHPSLFGSTGTRAAIETDNMAIGCQRFETQNSAVNSETIFPVDATPSRNAAKQSGHACAMHQTGLDRYRRRRAFVMREIPLYLLPAALRRGIAERGGTIYRAVIVRTHWNYYTIKCRCNTKKATGHRSPLEKSRSDAGYVFFHGGE